MPSYADVITGRILLREKLAAPEALFAALHEMQESLDRGAEMSLAEALERRAVVPAETIARVRDATPKVQHLESEKALARLVVDEGLATADKVRSVVEESRQGGFKVGLGVLLQRQGVLTEERAKAIFQTRQVALAEARVRREAALGELIRTLPPRYTPEEKVRLAKVFEVEEGARPTTIMPRTLLTEEALQSPPPPSPSVSESQSLTRQVLASASTEPRKIKPEECPIYGYEILAELGKGAMGVVYKARHIFTDRLTALKILPLKLARDSHYLERFKREAIAAMRLQHDNVVRAYDFGGSEEYYYLALEFVEGETLEKRLEREGRIQESVALDVTRQIASALDEASRQEIVHRDVKPENIMVTKDGVAKLCDFGIVKLLDRDEGAVTVAGTTVGTPFYIAPEQARGEEDLDTRTDLYALGITLFHLVTGRVPFTGKSQGAILVRHILEEVPDVRSVAKDVSSETAAIVKKLTRKKRDERYETPRALIADVERALALLRASPTA
ncbi:MAG TPA: serine/threonine-protein kinase [Planctomycetota bacterium]|nr:serine/threonine-protein kinase [Planctomycetota bacterium]